jgi:hypothetical protein
MNATERGIVAAQLRLRWKDTGPANRLRRTAAAVTRFAQNQRERRVVRLARLRVLTRTAPHGCGASRRVGGVQAANGIPLLTALSLNGFGCA